MKMNAHLGWINKGLKKTTKGVQGHMCLDIQGFKWHTT
jgi:hypothetical protein